MVRGWNLGLEVGEDIELSIERLRISKIRSIATPPKEGVSRHNLKSFKINTTRSETLDMTLGKVFPYDSDETDRSEVTGTYCEVVCGPPERLGSASGRGLDVIKSD